MNTKPAAPVFVIGINAVAGTIKVLKQDLSTEFLALPLDSENPATLGQSLVITPEGFASAGNDCLHYTDFEDRTTPVMFTPEWEHLLTTKLQWSGWGTTSQARVASDYTNMVYLSSLGKACHRPVEMDPSFEGEVFVFRAGVLDLNIEPIVPFGWIEALERLEDGNIEVTIVQQSVEGWGADNHLAKRTYFVASELELLIQWRTRFLNTSLLGKAIDLETHNLLPQYPEHPVPTPGYNVSVRCNHPHSANYCVDAETNSIQSLADVVVRNGKRGDYNNNTGIKANG